MEEKTNKKMLISEKMQKIADKFKILQESESIVKSNHKTANFGSNGYLKNAMEIVRSHLNENGRTEIPISFKEYATEIGFKSNTDFNHMRDKTLRLFEIATICVLGLEKPENFTGLYRTENTQKIRKHLNRNENVFITFDKNDQTDMYLSLDVSSKLQ